MVRQRQHFSAIKEILLALVLSCVFHSLNLSDTPEMLSVRDLMPFHLLHRRN